MSALVHLLAPLFLDARGDVAFARMAARSVLEEYRVASRMDLLSVAQVVAFGLAALGSLSLSMTDDLDVRLVLRLRGNAVALNRAAERGRRALERGQAAAGPVAADRVVADPVATDQPASAPVAAAADPGPAAAAASARAKSPAPTDTLDTVAPPNAIVSAREPRDRTLHAARTTEPTEAHFAHLDKLPPPERKAPSFRAQALSGTATGPLAGTPPPACRFSLRDAMKTPGAA